MYEQIKKKGFDKILKDEFDKGKNIIGICVGMQIMLKIGEETKGLDIIDGNVKNFDQRKTTYYRLV